MKRSGKLKFLQWILPLLVLVIESVPIGCASDTETQVIQPEGKASSGRPRYAAGRILVKLTPKAAGQMEKALDKTTGLILTENLPINALHEVSRRYRVTSWKRVFPQPMKDDSAGLERVYRLSCNPKVDIMEAARTFSALTDLVQYAEPDRLATIQAGGGMTP